MLQPNQQTPFAAPLDSPRFAFARVVRHSSASLRTSPASNQNDRSGSDFAGLSSPSCRSHSARLRVRRPRCTWTAGIDPEPPVPANINPGLTPKICMHGATCVKYGCTFSHPACRPVDCPLGKFCTVATCAMHHPRSRPIPQYKPTPECRYGLHCSQRDTCPFRHPLCPPVCPPTTEYTGFKVGQQVEAQRTVGGAWDHATIRRVRGARLAVTFKDSIVAVNIPRSCVRHLAGTTNNEASQDKAPPAAAIVIGESKINESKTDEPSRAFAHSVTTSVSESPHLRLSPMSPPHRTPRHSSGQFSPQAAGSPLVNGDSAQQLRSLEAQKQAAIVREDYLEAQRFKNLIARTRRVVSLQLQKVAAVRKEDYLRAMQLKKQIQELQQQTTETEDKETKESECAIRCGTSSSNSTDQQNLVQPGA